MYQLILHGLRLNVRKNTIARILIGSFNCLSVDIISNYLFTIRASVTAF